MEEISRQDTDMLMSELATGDHFFAIDGGGEYEERLVVGTFDPQLQRSSVSSVVVGGDQSDVRVSQFEEFFKLQAVNSLDGVPHVVRKPLPDGIKFIEKMDVRGNIGPEPTGTVMMFDMSAGCDIPRGWAVMDGVDNAKGSAIAFAG